MRGSECPKCQGSMTQGYMLDIGDNNRRTVGKWVEGAPEKSFWLGLKTGDRATYDIQTFRCGRCGFLENYAKG